MEVMASLRVLKYVMPYGFVELRRKFARKRLHYQRHRRIRDYQNILSLSVPIERDTLFIYEDAVRILASYGVPEHHIREGSIPEDSLNFAFEVIAKNLDLSGPIVGLHVGNFVGVSLCALGSFVKSIHPKSVVVSIDPNISHRDVSNPHTYVCKLAENYGLLSTILPVVAFSHERSTRDDGIQFSESSIEESIKCDIGFQNGLGLLKRVCLPSSFSVAFLDGNHDANYLEREIELVRPMLKEGGIVILDDVDENWGEIKALYMSVQNDKWRDLGTNGRVGLLRKI
jgi:hypothetical protein